VIRIWGKIDMTHNEKNDFPLGIGDVIKFGPYDWSVLDVQEGKALIITEKVVEDRAYHETETDITWSDCTLRQYLNGEFYDSFGASDKARIAATKNANRDNPWYGTRGGEDTTDKVFLLSLEEVVRYFGDSGQLQLVNRDESSAEIDELNSEIDDYYNEERTACDNDMVDTMWWLRSPGSLSILAASVDDLGVIDVKGYGVFGNGGGVRPALWLML
jgi:hypothetical protein